MAEQENEKKTDISMDAVDPEEYKKFLESDTESLILEEITTAIEVKSNLHELQQKEQEEKQEKKENVHTAVNEIFDWMESLITAIITIVLIFTFIVRINTVDGTSMVPTLSAGQKLLVTDLFYTPDYNDIVIVQAVRLDGGKPIVKRIVGLPGDTIKIDFDQGIVYRNGEALEVEMENGYLTEDGHKINSYTTAREEMESNVDYVVPEDCYFVMGDNRNGSKDSRTFSEIGFVPKDCVAGKAFFSIFPFNSFGTL
ncbi:MAG: signal peptidase I [Firmicutes bacterium]|nr:signal peptidase I [[Eubacterium] siraeum]MCM1487470.1 signal peptidase I [Bacillota bacterium]